MRNNRIFREGQMNKNDVKVMNEALDNFFKRNYAGKSEEEREAEREANPNYIKVDGKWYDQRIYKGQ